MNITDVFIASSAKHRTYIEQINFAGQNFLQKPLGTICGFFVVRDKNSWSSHIVHFLTAEFKKEYFAIPKRPLPESFAAALHHTNRALAELAKNDHIDWIGMLDSVLCAYDDKSIHFSVTGEGYILLLRNGELMDIGEGLAPDSENPNPLKTFVDTASGELLPGDKLIITTRELLDLISFDELSHNAKRFSSDEFVQFISTALLNETEMASTQVIDVYERFTPEKSAEETQPDPENLVDAENSLEEEVIVPDNAFSAQTFDKKTAPKLSTTKTVASKNTEKELVDPLPEAEDELPSEYTDKRTGHIYVSGESQEKPSHRFTPLVEHSRDLLSDVSYFGKKSSARVYKKTLFIISQTPMLLGKSRDFLIIISKRFLPVQDTKKDSLQDDVEDFIEEIPSESSAPTEVPEDDMRPVEEIISDTQGEQKTSFFQNIKSYLPSTSSLSSLSSSLPTPSLPNFSLRKKSEEDEIAHELDETTTLEEALEIQESSSRPEEIEEVTKISQIAKNEPLAVERITEASPEERIELLTDLYTDHGEDSDSVDYTPEQYTPTSQTHPTTIAARAEQIINFIKKTLSSAVHRISSLTRKSLPLGGSQISEEDLSHVDTPNAEYSHPPLISFSENIIETFSSLFKKLISWLTGLSFVSKIVLIAILAILLVLPFIALIKNVRSQKIQVEQQELKEKEQFQEGLQETVVEETASESPAEVTQEFTEETEEENTPQTTSNNTIPDPSVLSQNTKAVLATALKGSLLFPHKDALLRIEGTSSRGIKLPRNIGNIAHASANEDLGLLFFITDKDLIYAYNPKGDVFTEQTFPAGLDHTQILTLTSYQRKLYFATKQSGIVRYDRAVSGFNKPKEWIEDGTNANNISSLMIDGRVYITQDGKLTVFESGKQISESGQSKITSNLLWATEDSTSLWAINQNEIYKLNKETFVIEDTFRHSNISTVQSFFVDEINNTAYLALENNVSSFKLVNTQ